MSNLRLEDAPSRYDIYVKLKLRVMELLSVNPPSTSSTRELKVVLEHLQEYH